MEGSATDGSKRRLPKPDKLRTPQGLPAKAQEIRIANLVPSAQPVQPEDVDLVKVREDIIEIMGIFRGSVTFLDFFYHVFLHDVKSRKWAVLAKKWLTHGETRYSAFFCCSFFGCMP